MISLYYFLHNIFVINPSQLIDCCVVISTTTAERFFTPAVMGFDVIHKE
ncbi:MAG TPA: hypothetical protein PLP19_20815 [bacterium]|nr:hypothetical protein [bacterium]HPN45938.1 hypothetical protein [bacterium]